VIFGGEALELRTLKPWVERHGAENPQLVNMYGITETTVHVTYRVLTRDEIDSEQGSVVGKPLPDLRCYLLDRHGRPVPRGAVGEIYVGGAGVARGYLNRPELTAQRFLPDLFAGYPEAVMYRAGDLGRWRPDGSIEYLGRNDQQLKIRGFRIELGEIETQLVRHPQVKEAVVIGREDIPGERRLVGYVTANLEQLKAEAAHANPAGARIVSQWKRLYEETYAGGSSGPSFVGWNSSYTGRPIPDDQMREWLRTTVERIRSFDPHRILEIGCGRGLVLEQLAPDCSVYDGSDLSGEALEHLRSWTTGRSDLQHVRLQQCAALDLVGPRRGDYDTVILNSVVQYFPDSEYLRAVLVKSADWLAPGGRLFVGDVRHLGLLRAFHSSVQLERARPEVSVATLKERVARAMELEKELVIDPRFFQDIARTAAGIGRILVLLKRGASDNELTRYRYDVVLEKGAPHATTTDEKQYSWAPRKDWISEIRARMTDEHPPVLRIRGVRNRRLFRDVTAVRLIQESGPGCTADALRNTLEQLEPEGETPESFWQLGEAQGYDVRVTWELGRDDGRFDVEFVDRVALPTQEVVAPLPWPIGPAIPCDASYANDPLGSALKQQLVSQVRFYLEEKLPSHMIPSALVVLERFPLTPNGKLDRRALPAPASGAYARREYEVPEGEVEQLLATIWQDLLRVERVGRLDHFFELGGHSLLVVQLIDRLRGAGLYADVRLVFDSPMLATLAAALTARVPEDVGVAANLIPPGCQAITPQMLPLVDLGHEQIARIARSVTGGMGNIQDIYPLAPLQEGILFHHMLDETSADPYVVPTLLSVSSREKLQKLVAALEAVIERHDVLRSAVVWDDLPCAVQVVHRRVKLPIEELVLESGSDPVEQLTERMARRHHRIDLQQAPLMRLQIAADARGERWFALLLIHHLATDHLGLQVVISEMMTHVSGRAADLPEPMPYRTHVAQALAYARDRDAETFFRAKLSGIDEPTAPFGLLDVHGDGSRIEESRLEMEPGLARRLRLQARTLGLTPATLFHTAWALVVAHTSGREDVVYGTVLLGRLQGSADTHRILGLFINTLPLRLRLTGLTAGELSQQTQRELVELLNHEQTSLALAQRCSGMPASTPLFSALLNYRQDPGSEWLDDASGIEVLSREGLTNYPVTLSVDDLCEGFRLTGQTDRRIDPSRVVRYMHTALQSLVKALEQAPDTPALQLSILPDLEWREIESFNATRVESPRHALIHQLFEDQALRTPQSVAIVHDGLSLTYAELNTRANQLARYLASEGVRPNGLVGICLERCPEMIVGLLGTLKAGGAYLPLDPSYPSERLQYMLKDASPGLVLMSESLRSQLPESRAKKIVLDAKLKEIAGYAHDNLPATGVGATRESLVYVIYTSGSTGRPKGTALPHGSLVNLIEWHRETFGDAEGRHVLQFAALSFDVAFQEIFSTLCTGGTLVLLDEGVRRDVRALAQLLSDRSIDRLFVPPLMLQTLAEFYRMTEAPRHELRDVITAGEQLRISPEIMACLGGGCRLHNHYGPTETHVVTSLTLTGDPGAWPALPSIGRPIANTRIYVLDAERRPNPIDVAGEIYIGGVAVGCGYLNNTEMTSMRFIADPFDPAPRARLYRTGDLGRWKADGTLEYLGRNDEQVKLRGYRIELGEIETQLARHPQVKETAVVIREDSPGMKRLVAYVTRRGEGNPEAEGLRSHVKAVLPEYMVPSAFVVLEALPLTPSGKLDRRGLPAPLEGSVSRRFQLPQGEVEQAVAQLWQELLRVERVGREDDFFDLGGHSILAMQLIVRIRSLFSVQIPLGLLFECSTLQRLSARVVEMRDASLLEEVAAGGDDARDLLERVASMPESQVQELVRKLTLGGRS
jgi:amino acid adenylation domain-containing protein